LYQISHLPVKRNHGLLLNIDVKKPGRPALPGKMIEKELDAAASVAIFSKRSE
jgi:hypothetical protein